MAREKIYETDDQGVHYIVTTDSANGRRAEAESSSRAEMGTIRRTRTEASSRADDQWTVARLWDEYQTANPALKGMSVYRAIFNAHLSRPFGSMQPAEISPFDLDRLKLDEMKGRSPKSIANALELLRRIINFGIRRGLCPGPRFTIQLPRVNNEKTEDLTGEELGCLVSVLDRHLEVRSSRTAGAAMMKLALYTGMRRGEIFRLKWSDLDFHRNNILLREPKGGRNVVIPMSSHTRLLLESLRRSGNDCRSDCGSDRRSGRRSDYVFPGRGGRQRRDVRKQVNAIKVEAGLPGDLVEQVTKAAEGCFPSERE